MDSSEIQAAFQDRTVVDTDVHVAVPAEEMAKYVDEPVKSRLVDSYAVPVHGGSDWNPSMGGQIPQQEEIKSPDDVERIVHGDHSIEHPILNPTLGLGKISKPELAVELMRARNEAFIETYLSGTDLHGLGVITEKAPGMVAEEIDRLGDEDGIVGLVIECLGTKTPLGDPSLDPIYEAAEDNDLPIAYHTTAAGDFMYSFPIQKKGVNSFFEVHTLGHLWGPTLTLTSLLAQGVPAKFPDLEFVFLEAGLSWVPHQMWQLNRTYAMRREEAPLLDARPGEYIREQFYFSTHPFGQPDDPARLRDLIDTVGIDSVLFASDYPHWDAESPGDVGERFTSVFSLEECKQILERTPAEVFDLVL